MAIEEINITEHLRQIRLLLQSVSESSGTFYDPEDKTVICNIILVDSHMLLLSEEDEGVADPRDKEHGRLKDPKLLLLHPPHLRQRRYKEG